jgi:putative FmdB family regulatory protein
VPIYEYEPRDHDCLMCDGRVAAIQGIEEPPLEYCPDCGLEVRRVVSAASFKISNTALKSSGDKGFTTWKKVESGRWEKVSGPGVDVITGDPNSVKTPEPKKPLEL